MKVTIALPVLNEEMVLRRSVKQLVGFVRSHMPEAGCTLVIADNGSDDRTGEIGQQLMSDYDEVEYLRLNERGKGLAVVSSWQKFPADVYAFMDIDLSTDLAALPELCNVAFNTGGLAAGSRFHKDSVVVRSLARRVISICYRLVLRRAFGTSISDAPCGFKAVSAAVFKEVVPEVKDRRWFFDTELVIRAEKKKFPINEIPINWKESVTQGRKSRVNVPRLAREYLRQVRRLKKDLQ